MHNHARSKDSCFDWYLIFRASQGYFSGGRLVLPGLERRLVLSLAIAQATGLWLNRITR
jgi:hypothetical protein